MRAFWALLSWFWMPLARSHVGLTFPPARKYDLDFLDTFRTVTPCGMLKGDGKTLVESGNDLTITWHLGYPHRGGFKLELLDSSDKKLTDLTPKDTYLAADDTTAQEYTVSIPADLRCPDCTIRLLRQALEWGPKYRFQSCADVDIVAAAEYSNKCSGNGIPKSGGLCDCKRTYSGEQCQYKDDCVDDTDCTGHGRCLDNGGTALPLKECYCEAGYFGQACEKKSVLRTKKLNESNQYEEIKLLGSDLKFMWRFVGGNADEVEGVVVANTLSYVALGWRPDDITKSCQKFPFDAVAPRSRDFHPMDCQDVVIAKVKGDLSNIGDYYTRDRSTPRRDSYYGGKDDLTAAIGWEEDGVTIFMFRKPAAGSRDSGKADHDFSGMIKLIWAFGQSGKDFFKEDELKYHGGNRGEQTLGLGKESLSEQRLLLVVAVALLGFVLIFQLVHKLIERHPYKSKNPEENPMMRMK